MITLTRTRDTVLGESEKPAGWTKQRQRWQAREGMEGPEELMSVKLAQRGPP